MQINSETVPPPTNPFAKQLVAIHAVSIQAGAPSQPIAQYKDLSYLPFTVGGVCKKYRLWRQHSARQSIARIRIMIAGVVILFTRA